MVGLDMRRLNMKSEGQRSQLAEQVLLILLDYEYGMAGCLQLRNVAGIL